MRRFVQSADKPVTTNDGDPLVVRCSGSPPKTHLVLFVHGLDGHQYDTWGAFPRLFFACGAEDIWLCGYPTGFRRIGRLTATFDQQAEELGISFGIANTIRSF